METKTLFQKYHKRVVVIGVIKSLLVGLAAGLAAVTLLAFITWFTPLSLGWVLGLSLGSGILVGGITGFLVYRMVFRPTPQMIARLVDKLGLEERAITMYELENDESYLSFCQREDATEKLKDVNERQLKYHLSKVVIAMVSISCVLALSMMTVSSLAAVGRLGKAYEYIFPEEEPEEPVEYVEVYYLAHENGSIEGEGHQTIVKGGNTKTVRAVPDEGYQFLQWTDGILTPERRDWEVMEDFAVEAIFLKPTESDQGDRESEEGQKGDSPEDDPNKEGTQEGDESEKEEEGGDKDGDTGEEKDQETEGDDTDDGGEESGATGTLGQNDNNTVIDGATNYESEFDYDSSKEDVESDPSIPDELKDVLSDYFDSLKP